MASGDSLCSFLPSEYEPPSSNYAPWSLRNNHPILVFADGATTFAAVWTEILPRNYAGGGLTVTIIWSAVPTSGNVEWIGAIERMDTGTDLDADSFASNQLSGATAVPGTSGAPKYTTLTFSSGANMDSLAAGEAFRLKISRDPSVANDTAAGNAEILAIEVKET